MTRHGKNCTAGAVYTYHEKKKDTGDVFLLVLCIHVCHEMIEMWLQCQIVHLTSYFQPLLVMGHKVCVWGRTRSKILTAAVSPCSPAGTPSSRTRHMCTHRNGLMLKLSACGLKWLYWVLLDHLCLSCLETGVNVCLFIFVYCSEDGYLYEKEAILQYILHHKTEIAKKMKV